MTANIRHAIFLSCAVLCCTVLMHLLPESMAVGETVTAATAPLSNERPARIVYNQVGYPKGWPKVAFLVYTAEPAQPAAPHVALIDVETRQVVRQFLPGTASQDPASQDTIQPLVFSTFGTPGRYYLRYGTIQSGVFSIQDTVYLEPLKTMLRSYYLQRCGVAIHDPVTLIQHAACHLEDGVLARDDSVSAAGMKLASAGGWHDAGDYGKYVSTTAVTIGRLLSLYEHCPQLFQDAQLAIPESGNGISDILDEVRVGIDWMLSMQRTDGAVYRKLSGERWPKLIPPDADVQKRLVYGFSTPDTAKFAAALAMAARVYMQIDPAFATRCLTAAERAWKFLGSQAPETMQVDWLASDDSGSGKYLLSETDQEEALKTDLNDRFWAAAELWITTQQVQFRAYLGKHLPQTAFSLFEWKDPSALGMMSYVFHTPNAGDPLATQIRTKLLDRAEQLLHKVTNSGYRLANDRFVWGSNKMTAEEGITLLYAYRLTGRDAYRTAAIDQLDYLFGRNHFGLSFVSGVGSQAVKHTSHIFARAQQLLIPGLLSGGPNTVAQSGIARKGKGPLSYIDDAASYATNENAIDYNASLIALVGLLMSET